jgi:hypothetical protein
MKRDKDPGITTSLAELIGSWAKIWARSRIALEMPSGIIMEGMTKTITMMTTEMIEVMVIFRFLR